MPERDPVVCILLSIKFDPFIVTAYLRRGRFGGMSRRDWRIFLLSWLIANAWWSVVCFTGLSAVELGLDLAERVSVMPIRE